jgi:hypothetical protein
MSIEFPNTGSFSFSDLTFGTTITTPPNNYSFTTAKVLFGASGMNYPGGGISGLLISNIVLAGQGITTTSTIPGNSSLYSFFGNSGIGTNVTNPSDAGSYASSQAITLDTPLATWDSTSNKVSFTVEYIGGLGSAAASGPPGARLYYAVQYFLTVGSYTFVSTAFGNVDLIAAGGQPTFGLPASTVALITSRHGSVANFLRLRNQGYV